jgi:branched-chain amino acid transport system permease protein
MESFINATVSGLISGSLYASMALGLTILYGISHVWNFGHGIVAVTGGYITWTLMDRMGLGLLPSIIISLPVMAAFGWILYFLTIDRLIKKPNWEYSTIVFLWGFGIMLENAIQQIFGPRIKSIPQIIQGDIEIGFVSITWHEIFLALIVVTTIVGLSFFFKYTQIGQAMRAVAESPEGAKVVGINIRKIFGYTFALAFAITGFSGILLGSKYYMTPHVGWGWMIKGFLIVVFGGLGSTTGTIYAAVLLGLVEAFVALHLGLIWIWPAWFIIFIITLLIRPQGILGGWA